MESLVKLLKKMYDKNPILFNVVKYASVLDPKFLVSEPPGCMQIIVPNVAFYSYLFKNRIFITSRSSPL